MDFAVTGEFAATTYFVVRRIAISIVEHLLQSDAKLRFSSGELLVNQEPL
jgi:hypothetical protein